MRRTEVAGGRRRVAGSLQRMISRRHFNVGGNSSCYSQKISIQTPDTTVDRNRPDVSVFAA
jgi:hypothetical protein